MKSFTLILLVMLFNLAGASVLAEKSPFTDIKYGWMLGRGDYIEVKNPELFDEDKRHFLIEVNGRDYKDIIKDTKALYGKKYKCMLAEHFLESMAAIGVSVSEEVDLKLYMFDWGHKVFDLKDVPVTEDNLDEIMFNRSHCE